MHLSGCTGGVGFFCTSTFLHTCAHCFVFLLFAHEHIDVRTVIDLLTFLLISKVPGKCGYDRLF